MRSTPAETNVRDSLDRLSQENRWLLLTVLPSLPPNATIAEVFATLRKKMDDQDEIPMDLRVQQPMFLASEMSTTPEAWLTKVNLDEGLELIQDFERWLEEINTLVEAGLINRANPLKYAKAQLTDSLTSSNKTADHVRGYIRILESSGQVNDNSTVGQLEEVTASRIRSIKQRLEELRAS